MIREEETSGHEDFVLLLYAQDMAEAEFYRALLEDHDIQVTFSDEEPAHEGADPGGTIAVMVAEEALEAAQEIIEQRVHLDEELYVGFEDSEADDDDDDDDDEDEELEEIEETENVDPAPSALSDEYDEDEDEDFYDENFSEDEEF